MTASATEPLEAIHADLEALSDYGEVLALLLADCGPGVDLPPATARRALELLAEARERLEAVGELLGLGVDPAGLAGRV
jgi:hypothetical protein